MIDRLLDGYARGAYTKMEVIHQLIAMEPCELPNEFSKEIRELSAEPKYVLVFRMGSYLGGNMPDLSQPRYECLCRWHRYFKERT